MNPVDSNTEQTLADRMKAVEDALTAQSPALQMHMVKLHAFLKQQPELVHILTDEQIAKMIGAYTRLSNSNIVQLTSGTSSKSSSKKSFSAAQLGFDMDMES